MMSESLGTRLRRLRLARGMSQAELAAPHYSSPYVSFIEAGKRAPSPSALQHFATTLGVDVEELATGRHPTMRAELEYRLQEGYSAIYSARYDEASVMFTEVAAAAAANELTSIQARAEEGQGLVTERRGDAELALSHFQKALELWAGEALPMRVEAIAGIARCTQMRGELRYAIHVLESFLMELRNDRLEDPLALMRVHSSLIWPYTEAGLYRKASDAAAEALRHEPGVESSEQVANMHMNVARELLREGHSDAALRSLQRAEDLYRVLNWKTELARAHANKAIVLAQDGDLEQARSQTMVALELIRGTSSKLSEARALNELARVDRLLGRVPEAISALKNSIALLADADVGELALAHRELGLCYVGTHPRLAERHLKKAIALYRDAGQHLHVAATYRELGDLLCSEGREQSGRDAYREGLLALDAEAA